MRIGHLTTDFLPLTGGAEAYVHDLVEALKPAEQTVYQLDTGIARPDIVPVRRLPEPWRKRPLDVWLYGLMLAPHMGRLHHEDLLVVHYALYYPLLAWHPRTVVVSHGVEWREPPDTLSHRLRRQAARAAFQGAWRLVANDSDFFRRMGCDLPPGEGFFSEVAPGRWFIPNCIDTDRFRCCGTHPAIAGRQALLVPRNIHPRRGVHLVVEAMPRILQSFPDLSLVVAGAFVDQPYRERILQMVEALGLSDKVLFLGSVPRDDMPSVYSSCLLTVVPSLLGEGTSLAALESMSCGTPVVSTSIGGLADLPTAKCGPDAGSLAQSVIDALQDRDVLACRQAETVRRTFNIDNWRRAWRQVADLD